MALQGSIDTFALDDVLRLVASTGKTGRLNLKGTRGEGELVVRDGRVLGGSVSTDERAAELQELVFEMLRFDDGEFVFEAAEVDDDGIEPAEVDGVLESAAELLTEWRDIEQVVPSRWASVTLVRELPEGEVTIDPVQWRMIAAIGSGAAVAQLAERLDASDLTTGRMLRSLIEAGLVDVGEAIEDQVEPIGEVAPLEVHDEPVAQYPPFTTEPATWADDPMPVNGNGNGNGHGEVDTDVLFDSVHQAPVALVEVLPAEELEGHDLDEGSALAPVVDAADFARRLAELPPQAAKAVAAAARATTVEERQAALAELDGTGEEVDHELLLQLLGPVES